MDLQEPSNEPQIWRQRRVMGGVDCQMSHSAEAQREQGDNVRGLNAFRPDTWLVISHEQVNLSWEYQGKAELVEHARSHCRSE